jgi:hypothetical protein
MRPRIGISSRLLEEETRSVGTRRFLTDELGAYVDWVPYAADVETGLGALWETWRLTGQGRLVEEGRAYPAISGLPAPAALDGYVATGDPREVQGGPWYPVDGQSAFARRLGAAFPLLPVAGDRVLAHAVPRARFVDRVFARARLRELFAGHWRTRDLVAFHRRGAGQRRHARPDRQRHAPRVPQDQQAPRRRVAP